MNGSVAAVPLYAGVAGLALLSAGALAAIGRREAWAAALASLAIALWSAAVALAPEAPLGSLAGWLDGVRALLWFGLLLMLGRRLAGAPAARLLRRFLLLGTALGIAVLALPLAAEGTLALPWLGAPALLARLGLALATLLLAENLCRNAGDALRWHIVLPCIAAGGIAAFDMVVLADAALARGFSAPLLDARAVLAALALPLLLVAALRDRRWRGIPTVSRQVVFHGATLVLAGTFLAGVGMAGEVLRHLGPGWGLAAQASLIAGAAMALAVALTSRSARSRLSRLVVDHFFARRYDYRAEWQRMIAALSAPAGADDALLRALRAIADPLDSPAGALLMREEAAAGLAWAQSWNLPAEPVSLPFDHPLLARLETAGAAVVLGETPADLGAAFGPLWLAVPLRHHREGLLGAVLLAPPRAPFAIDREVEELLAMLGQEAALFLAERRAAETLADARALAAYAQRFAFVAHDVKTVASQLRLVLANAGTHIADPEFQRDMLTTIGAAATRIEGLIARLRTPEQQQVQAPGFVAPLGRLRALAARRPHPVRIDVEGRPPAFAAMQAERFDAALTHLLDNACEASSGGDPVRVAVRGEGGRLVLEISDRGPGMTAAFIRDELFRPLSTSKTNGNGIGAWQARDLLREAGGELAVVSRPGAGTTMRIILPGLEAVAERAAR